MRVVVDANVIFAALIKDGKTAHLLWNKKLTLFTPREFFDELANHHAEIIRKTHRGEDEFHEVMSLLLKRLIVRPAIQEFILRADSFSPDPDDSPYLALCLELCCPLWSNDRRLQNQRVVRVLTTQDFIDRKINHQYRK